LFARPYWCGSYGQTYDVGRRLAILPATGAAHGLPVYAAENPAWSPDGKRFAFNKAGAGGIFVARADGSRQRRITRDGYDPTWSPDGKQIAFVRNITSKNPEIFLVNANGAGQRRLTNNIGFDGDPAWSRPGGR
jgi:Tol biopolymer transport system component